MKFSFWDFLSLVLVVATIAVIVVVAVIFLYPDTSINPFPIPTIPPTIDVPTLTPTQYLLPPTWTPTPKIALTPAP